MVITVNWSKGILHTMNRYIDDVRRRRRVFAVVVAVAVVVAALSWRLMSSGGDAWSDVVTDDFDTGHYAEWCSNR